MFKFIIAALVMIYVPTGALAAKKEPGAQYDIPDSVETIKSMKPIFCEKTIPLLMKFTEDENEQLLSKYYDPVTQTKGIIFWNSKLSILHVIEFPATLSGEWGCLVVFGTNVHMNSNGIKKSGQRIHYRPRL